MSKTSKNFLDFIKLIAVALLIAAMFFLWPKNVDKNGLNRNPLSDMGGDFILQSSDGPVSLSDYKGKVVILYFGYAYCPDICPTSLGLLSQAMDKLKVDELSNVQALFISVDPERDTVEKLEKYAEAFHPNIKGVTGTPIEIADVTSRYGASYMKVEIPDSALGYAVDHSSKYYLINRSGKLNKLVDHGTSPNNIVAALRAML